MNEETLSADIQLWLQFSFRPLFQTLDMNNILLVFSCLVLEYKVPLVTAIII